MDWDKTFKRVGTHHGRFHADEVVATAILKEIFDIEVTRTRNEEILRELDIVYDVGGGEFDHHGVEKEYRENGIPYAACGLIWRRYGRDVIHFRDPELREDEIDSVFGYVDRVLIQGIDALDNGRDLECEDFYVINLSTIIAGFNPPWYSEKSEDEAFNEAVALTSQILNNTLNNRFSVLKSREIVRKAFNDRKIPEVIILDTYCPWGENLRDIDRENEVLYVIYPGKENYNLQTVRGRGRVDKKPLPQSWAGLRDEELAAVTGVEDSVFCHTGRFIAVARSVEGIMKLADLAIKEPYEEKKEKRRGLLRFLTKLFRR